MLALKESLLEILPNRKGKKSDKKQKQSNNQPIFVLPAKEIGDLVLGLDGKYKMITKISPVNGELLGEDELQNVCEAIKGALSTYEGRFQILIQSERINIETNLIHIEKHKETLTQEIKVLVLDEIKDYLSSMANRSRNVLSFYVVFEKSAKTYILAEQFLEDTLASFKSEMESEEMFVDRLLEHDIKKLLYERMNPEQSIVEPYQESFNIENLVPSNAKRLKDGRHLEIENKLYRFYAITKYPENVDAYRWLRKIFKVNGDIHISITCTPKNKATINEELSKAYKAIGTKKKEAKDQDLIKKYEKEQISTDEIIERLGSDNISLYDTNITIAICEENLDKLNTLSELTRAKISSSFCQSTELKYKEFEPFFTTLPLLVDNKITQNYVWNLTTEDIASIIPFDSSELMEEHGLVWGDNVTSKGVVILNPYNKIYNNPHLCIIADSGSGKSFFIGTNVIRQLPYRDYIIQFDLDGSAKFPWATKYKFNPTSGIITNPFHIRNAVISSEEGDDKIDVGSFLAVKIMDLITFFKWILPDMKPFDEALLEEDIRETFNEVGLNFESKELPEIFPTFSTLAEVMTRKIMDKSENNSDKARECRINMKASLNPYINGSYASMFNGQTNWEYKFHTIFDLSKLPEAVKNPLYELLLKDTWQFVKKDGTLDKMPVKKYKSVIIDECHLFADINNPQTLKFISTELIKQSRKFGVNVITATQNIADLLSIPKYGQAILDNSFFKLFFRLGETDQPIAEKLYSFSKPEMDIIKAKKSKRAGSKGKGIFIAGSQRVILQVRASKFELEIIDPNQYQDIYKVPSRYYGLNTEVS